MVNVGNVLAELPTYIDAISLLFAAIFLKMPDLPTILTFHQFVLALCSAMETPPSFGGYPFALTFMSKLRIHIFPVLPRLHLPPLPRLHPLSKYVESN